MVQSITSPKHQTMDPMLKMGKGHQVVDFVR